MKKTMNDAKQQVALLPGVLPGQMAEIFIPVADGFMCDGSVEEGDRLRVVLGAPLNDGDNVLATVGGRCTVKTYCHDEDGEQWLVSCSEERDALRLDDDADVRLLGRVTGVEKTSPRTAFRECLRAIRRTKSKRYRAVGVTDERVDAVVVQMGGAVRLARQWYAVYRALLDRQGETFDSLRDFSLRVRRLLPEHGHLPTAKELQRMAVQSFSKPVAQWTPSNAPVSGTRYADYLHIALLTASLL